MKTLDEVIKALENVALADTDGESEGYYLAVDSLHYLKEYKNTDENYKKAIAHVTEVIDHYEKMVADYLSVNNPALTWDELQQMEGKPVWVEYIKGGKRVDAEWIVIKKVKSTCIENTSGRFQVDSLGWTWQAYRKERE